jgi:hypothetical protein
MKEVVAVFVRVLLIFIVGGLGLVGLLMSACGGLLLLFGTRDREVGSLLMGGLIFVGVAVLVSRWLDKASPRAVVITFLVLLLPALAWLAFKLHGH